MCDVCSFIGSYILQTNIIYWKHTWHMDKCVNRWSTNLWMNECHTNFTFFDKSICQMCFQCTISMCETYELWMNKFCTISIIKTWDTKFIQPNYFISFLLPFLITTSYPYNYFTPFPYPPIWIWKDKLTCAFACPWYCSN